ncbi:MAG: hypothetical protein ACK4S4_03735 [Pyrinomonadaceae bacterium]
MTRRVQFPLILAAFIVFSGVAFGQLAAASTSPATPAFFPLSELREGMRGTARTVFRGSRPEEFGVEILGILPGAIGPKQDLIVGRLNGGPADRTAVFAGMSGSPVYIDGKLVGAISYSFPFSKEPICGITPIEQMIGIFEQHPASNKNVAREPRAVSFAELAATRLPAEFEDAFGSTPPSVAGSAVPSVAGQAFRPIATPLTFAGISQQVLDLYAPQLSRAGLLPVGGAGARAESGPLKKADDATLLGGASVSMQLARGDYSLAASGTVTLRSGEKIYAFGHPFLGLGSADLPMSESHVVTVVPNLNNSFKLAVPDAMVGAMTQDRATGVFGTLGRAPKMIPVRIDLETSRGQTQTINFEIANDDFLTPILLNIGVVNALVSNERNIGDATIEIDGDIKVAGAGPIKLRRRVAGAQAVPMAGLSVALPMNALLRSQFDDLAVSGIAIRLRTTEGSRIATLERIAVDRTQVRPGETVEVQAFARTSSGKTYLQRIPVTVPADAAAGTMTIRVGDGVAMQQNAPVQQFVPRSIADFVSTVNRLKTPDRLYVQLTRSTSGVVVGVSEMPNLPPSVLATMNSERVAGGPPQVVQSILSEVELPPADFIVSGQQSLNIQIVR